MVVELAARLVLDPVIVILAHRRQVALEEGVQARPLGGGEVGVKDVVGVERGQRPDGVVHAHVVVLELEGVIGEPEQDAFGLWRRAAAEGETRLARAQLRARSAHFSGTIHV